MDLKKKLAQFKAMDGERFIDDELYIVNRAIVQVYLQAGRYSFPCHICGIYSELYVDKDRRSVYIENGLPYRAEFKVGTLDEHGYFHYTADENTEGVKAA